MVEAARIKPGDRVVEIGPGTGVLTETLLTARATVIALEADARAVTVLKTRFAAEIASGQLTLLHLDARELTDVFFQTYCATPYAVVANIPYYLSGHLFRVFLEATHQPHTLVFLVQKEVAERIARDKKESLLSLSVKMYSDPVYIATVKKGNFTPAPRVDSAIIALYDITRSHLKKGEGQAFFSLIHRGFSGKRKQLMTNLSTAYDRAALLHTFSTLGIRHDVRAEDLTIEDWRSLTEALALHT
jgi:16S rRNA (adenine1518-N6/adenine1519-N6)-dimethyltransferase